MTATVVVVIVSACLLTVLPLTKHYGSLVTVGVLVTPVLSAYSSRSSVPHSIAVIVDGTALLFTNSESTMSSAPNMVTKLGAGVNVSISCSEFSGGRGAVLLRQLCLTDDCYSFWLST